jgi:sigma-B regulation protein RsbU (phosphoserine phosphatase)
MPECDLVILSKERIFTCIGNWPEEALALVRAGKSGDNLRIYPLTVGRKKLAALAVKSPDRQAGRPLDNVLRRTLSLILQEALLAREAANRSRVTERRAQQLQIVMEITRELTSTFDLDKLLAMIMNASVTILKAGAGSLFLVDEATGDLIFREVTSGDTNLIGAHIPAGKGIIGEAAATGKPVVVQNVEDAKHFFAGLEHSGFHTQSLLAVPLTVPDRTLGVLELINKTDGSLFDQSDIDLLTTFAAQAAIAIENARHYQSAIVKERLEHEAQLAHDLQSSLIPRTTPDLEGWQFAAWWQPAREVSGDFYDFVLRPDRLDIVLGDVADKGMHAALFMALTRSTVRASLNPDHAPAECLTSANRLICADATGGMFVTLFYAALNPARREMTYVNCGHNPPLVAHRGDTSLLELKRTGLVLGFDAGFEYSQATLQFQPGDLMLMYTDGVTEAFNADKREFGEDRLKALIIQYKNRSAAGVLAALQQALHDHIGDTPQSDDITVLVAKCA